MKIVLTYLLIIISSFCKAQNLVPNPGFENYSNLPTTFSQSNLLLDWSNPSPNCFSCGTPDYYNDLSFSVSAAWSPLAASSGYGKLGMILYLDGFTNPNVREYITAPLNSPLITGKQYYVSIDRVYLEDSIHCISNNLAISFSTFSPNQPFNEVLNMSIHLEHDSLISNTSWQTSKFIYTADDNYTNITIGNFRDDTTTNVVCDSGASSAYVFIDNIIVRESGDCFDIIGDNAVCIGETNILSSSNNQNYTWSINSLENVIATNVPSINLTIDSSITLYAYDDTCLTAHYIEAYNPLGSNFNTLYYCNGDTASIATDLTSNFNFSNLSTNIITETECIIDTFSVNLAGCTFVDTVCFYFHEDPKTNLPPDTVLCYEGENMYFNQTWIEDTTYNFFLISSNGWDYTSHFIIGAENLTYYLEDTNGCIAKDSISFSVDTTVVFELLTEENYCDDQPANLILHGINADIVWHTGATGNIYSTTQPEMVYATTVSDLGCTFTDSAYVQFIDCEFYINMPNVFTPNNDGLNDEFVYSSIKGINSAEIKIFNRWGVQVFESTNINQPWNGTINKKPCSEGTYFWQINYINKFNETGTINGNCTLIR